ncbi:hypothetical protein DFA_06921 [Cavenderia fasciculata]|uniref:Protein kinase domain-containing protein n=1 Tax=Cavenderia fasciculata TaxID=261658 RepID=F4PX16_CACFS|nr:uncharacterized protein DFA_06921 [Cavenderia fasciculata]EGG19819.1 hypothetical protein DFA_06921 [Cavenderia fasciculata]|eukprot:XP_004358165.1 hypothetical protein DFA_06921 [Cavenderia fasciculata]
MKLFIGDDMFVQYKDHQDDTDLKKMYLLTHFYEGGDLEHLCQSIYGWNGSQKLKPHTEDKYLQKQQPSPDYKYITESEIWVYIRRLFLILEKLSQHNLAHLDIKPLNLFIRHDGQIVLGDFGSCHYFVAQENNDTFNMRTTTQASRGTNGYYAPESKQKKYYRSSDIYSVGSTILHLISCHPEDITNRKEFILNHKKDDFNADHIKISTVRYSQYLINFVKKLLIATPDDRFSLDDLNGEIVNEHTQRFTSFLINQQQILTSTTTLILDGEFNSPLTGLLPPTLLKLKLLGNFNQRIQFEDIPFEVKAIIFGPSFDCEIQGYLLNDLILAVGEKCYGTGRITLLEYDIMEWKNNDISISIDINHIGVISGVKVSIYPHLFCQIDKSKFEEANQHFGEYQNVEYPLDNMAKLFEFDEDNPHQVSNSKIDDIFRLVVIKNSYISRLIFESIRWIHRDVICTRAYKLSDAKVDSEWICAYRHYQLLSYLVSSMGTLEQEMQLMGGTGTFLHPVAMTWFCKGNTNYRIFRQMYDRYGRILFNRNKKGYIIDPCCVAGNMQIIQFLADNNFGTTINAIINASGAGHLHIVRWFTETRKERTTSAAMDAAAKGNHGDVARYLNENRTEGCTEACLDLFAEHGNLEMVKYLHQHNKPCTSKAMDKAASNGFKDVVEFLHLNRTEGCTSTAVDSAAQNGHHQLLTFLLENRSENGSPATLSYLAETGNLKLVQLFHQRGWNISARALDAASQGGFLEIVQFLHQNNYPCTTEAMDKAAENSHFDVLLFLQEHRTEGCTKSAMNNAAANGHLEVVKFLHEYRTEGCHKYAMNQAAINGYLEVVKFLHFNRTEGCSPYTMNNGNSYNESKFDKELVTIDRKL